MEFKGLGSQEAKACLTMALPCLWHTPCTFLSLADPGSAITALSLLLAAPSPSSCSRSSNSLELCWTALIDNLIANAEVKTETRAV